MSRIHEDEALGKAYDARLMQRLMHYIRPYRGAVAGAMVLLFVDGSLQLVGPWLTKQIHRRCAARRRHGDGAQRGRALTGHDRSRR